MNRIQRFSFLLCAVGLLGAVCSAQSVISAHSGLVHFVMGDVFLQDKPLTPTFGQFPDVKEGEVLRTGEGRAEILLTPGVFLRIAENSSFRMISTRLIDTRVELLTGSALVEAAEIMKDNAITFAVKDSTIEFPKPGLFRIDAGTGELRVYKGEAIAVHGDQTLTLKEGKMTQLAGVLSAEKFDSKTGDAFYRWASRRAGDLSAANFSAAKSLRDNGLTSKGAGIWQFNPYFGMFTFIPGSGSYFSPFGYYYYSARSIGGIYDRYANYGYAPSTGGFGSQNGGGPQYNSNLGYSTAARGDAGFSPAVSSSNNAAAAAPSARADAPAAGRSGGGGRGR